MPNVLLSGPAGSGKSSVARSLLAESEEPMIAADFQSIYAALTLAERENGRYPLRDDRLLPITEYVRRATIGAAVARGLGVVATNSDGDPARRRFLLERLGEGAQERIIDPGEEVIRRRLAESFEGTFSIVSPDCKAAIARWYIGGRRR